MRTTSLLVLFLALGCSGSPGPADAGGLDAGPTDAGIDSGTPDSGTPDGGTPDGGTPDSGTPDGGTPDGGTPDSGTPDSGTPDSGTPDSGTKLTLTISVPAFTVDAGTLTSFCYFFRTPNAAAAAVKSWRSRSTASVNYLSLWLTAAEQADAGTLSAGSCEQDPSKASWAYSAWEPDAGWSFPADDGAGHPLGKMLDAHTPAYLYLVVSNPTSGTLSSAAELELELYPADAGVTRADSLVAFNANINIPASGASTASATCPLPASTKFSWVSVFTHKQGQRARVLDGATTLFEGTNWEHPGASTYAAPAFPAPTGGAQYACEYVNPTNRTINTGFSIDLDEQCLMLSYIFPTNVPRVCVNNTLLP